VAIPILFFGIWLGNHLINKISRVAFYKGVIKIAILSGIFLLYSSLNELFNKGISLKSLGATFNHLR